MDSSHHNLSVPTGNCVGNYGLYQSTMPSAGTRSDTSARFATQRFAPRTAPRRPCFDRVSSAVDSMESMQELDKFRRACRFLYQAAS